MPQITEITKKNLLLSNEVLVRLDVNETRAVINLKEKDSEVDVEMSFETFEYLFDKCKRHRCMFKKRKEKQVYNAKKRRTK